MRKTIVALNNARLSLQGPQRNENLEVRFGYPDSLLSRFLFSQLGLMHLVAPYLPRLIETNFAVDPKTRELIRAMYSSELLTLTQPPPL